MCFSRQIRVGPYRDNKMAVDEKNESLDQSYKYGFVTKIRVDEAPKGLNEDIIKLISSKKKEPEFMLSFRLRAFEAWKKMKEPRWADLTYPEIDYQAIRYYSAPKDIVFGEALTGDSKESREVIRTFEKLGVPVQEENRLSTVAVDAVFDSVSVGTTHQKELTKAGVIFCPISEALIKYPELIKKYLGSVVPVSDNYFSALNSAVFTDGSFAFIPKGVDCPLDLSTYFRINSADTGQFERTLIVAEEGSNVNYIEGCTAPARSTTQLHAAVVELVALDDAKIKYSTVQNWYGGDEKGQGGIYNFVTKRGKCLGRNSSISWTQVEAGSAVTWKYPGCILIGENSTGAFYSVALTNNKMQADTGTKMIHVGKGTKSTIISKGISADGSKNSYRGLVKVMPSADHARSYSQCDSMLIGDQCSANTYPYIEVKNQSATIEHEASTSKINQEQLFYLESRGIDRESAISMIVSGFCRDVFCELPLEFAVEAQRLLEMKLENSVG